MPGRLLTLGSVLSLVVLLAVLTDPGLRNQHWVYTHESRDGSGVLLQRNFELAVQWRLGFEAYANRWNTWSVLTLVIPAWAIVAVLSFLPAVWFIRRRRPDARAARGLCRACGYDLRASPGRCPECGQDREAIIRGSVEGDGARKKSAARARLRS